MQQGHNNKEIMVDTKMTKDLCERCRAQMLTRGLLSRGISAKQVRVDSTTTRPMGIKGPWARSLWLKSAHEFALIKNLRFAVFA